MMYILKLDIVKHSEIVESVQKCLHLPQNVHFFELKIRWIYAAVWSLLEYLVRYSSEIIGVSSNRFFWGGR